MSQRMPQAVNAEDSAAPSLDRASADGFDLRHALAISQEHLAAALQQIDALLEQRSRHEQQLVRLAQAVAQARRRAYHDELTGLPNRALLLDRFKQAVALGARQQKQVALLFLDLDGFKSINDALGHAAGDRLLQQVAARLAACIRTSDTASRYGGDEFVILLPEVDGQQSAVSTAEKIRTHLAKPYHVGATVINVTTSIGIALYPVDGKECGDLIRVSDLEMYRDKSRAPAPPRILEPTPHT
jgi:diguanylate cyclase (GGDEF)-like protein